MGQSESIVDYSATIPQSAMNIMDGVIDSYPGGSQAIFGGSATDKMLMKFYRLYAANLKQDGYQTAPHAIAHTALRTVDEYQRLYKRKGSLRRRKRKSSKRKRRRKRKSSKRRRKRKSSKRRRKRKSSKRRRKRKSSRRRKRRY